MSRSVSKTVLWSCIRPFQLLFFEQVQAERVCRAIFDLSLTPIAQMCLNLCLLSAVLLGILYLFFGVCVTRLIVLQEC